MLGSKLTHIATLLDFDYRMGEFFAEFFAFDVLEQYHIELKNNSREQRFIRRYRALHSPIEGLLVFFRFFAVFLSFVEPAPRVGLCAYAMG